MRTLTIALLGLGLAAFAWLFFGGPGEFHTPWLAQKLPSGRTVKVTSMVLAWPDEHGPPDQPPGDFELEFVSANPGAAPAAREQEAREVFELIRPTAELWGMNEAIVSEFPTLQRKGRYDLYVFRREPGGSWRSEHQDRKVFATD